MILQLSVYSVILLTVTAITRKDLIMPEAASFVLEAANEPLHADTIDVAGPGPEEVLVEVAACGVCHTDLHVIKDEVAFPKPAVLGHEVSGVVRAVGEGVDHEGSGESSDYFDDRLVGGFHEISDNSSDTSSEW